MISLFECWNGGTAQWDQVQQPEFVFSFPPQDAEVVTFFQLSGRICEVMTQCEWQLNMGGQLLDIPDLPDNEIRNFVFGVRSGMGYASVPVACPLGTAYGSYVSVQLALWVNTHTGRADMYNPFQGLVYGQQLLRASHPNRSPQFDNFRMNMNPQGHVQGGRQ